MAGKAKKKIFFPKTRLSELAARAGGMLRDDALDGAMKSLEAMRAQADIEIRKSISAMEAIVFARDAGDTLDEGQMRDILRQADQIVTLAGTFCYPTLDNAARSLCGLANELCEGRIMGFGGGGYNRGNLAAAWCAVLDEFIQGSER